MEKINLTKEKRHLKTISLFSGAGGLDYGFLNAGFDIIWANDFDKYAVKSYKENIGDHIIEGDINNLLNDIPKHEVLIAGFPCQPFSMMGQKLGFNDEGRGTLFFTIETIIRKHNPKVVVLENVKGLENHNNGKTILKMKIILSELGYDVFLKVLNTADYGLPQTRRRLFIVCFRKDLYKNIKFEFPNPIKLTTNVQNLLDKNVDKKYFLSKKILKTIMASGTKNYSAKTEINLKIARPLCATMHKMHRASQDNYYIDEINRSKFSDCNMKEISNIRRLTPNECRKLQGFPNDWKQVVSDTQAYKQFGNAVSVNVAYYIAVNITKSLNIQIDKE